MKKIIWITLFSLSVTISTAQTLHNKFLPEIARSLNAQKTANTKDILTTLFRASLDSLLGKEHSFTFNASFYGLDSIFRGPRAKKLTYEDERKLRKNSFNISLAGDTANNIKKISGGFTFTIINKKDIVYTRFDKTDSLTLNRKANLIINLKAGIKEVFGLKRKELTENNLKIEKSRIDTSWNYADREKDFTKLHPYIIEALTANEIVGKILEQNDDQTSFTKEEVEEAITSVLLGRNPLHETFTKIAEKYARKPLWTVIPTAIYNREVEQGEFSVASEFTVGLGKNLDRKPLELEIKSQFKIANDTSLPKTNYDNKPFSISAGLNKVVMESEENEPKMEFKLFTQYDYQFGRVAGGAKPGLFTLNSTFRVKVFNSLWLPVTLKYDPENNNFLGLFSITANLGN